MSSTEKSNVPKPIFRVIHLTQLQTFFHEFRDEFTLPEKLSKTMDRLEKVVESKSMVQDDLFSDEDTNDIRFSLVEGIMELKKNGAELFNHDALKVLIEKSEEIVFEKQFQEDFVEKLVIKKEEV